MNIVCYSGGKDSTAMLLGLLELGIQIDKIIFADTLFEFPELYIYLDRIEKHIGRKIIRLTPEKGLFEKWYYGKVTRGKSEGVVRGYPLTLFPCWWTREAKVLPLQRAYKDADKVFIGIAYDEKHRMSTVDDNLFYPLVDWKWTEQDCINYLNEKDLFNPLYVNFNRLGCWLCPKQGENSLFVLWKLYPELWKKFEWWDRENYKIKGQYIFGIALKEIRERFEAGHEPQKMPKYLCWNGCEGVKHAFRQKQQNLGMFCEVNP